MHPKPKESAHQLVGTYSWYSTSKQWQEGTSLEMPVHDVFVLIPVSIHMTHSLILIEYQLSLLCIKWPALLALENINYHHLYSLWLHVRLIQNSRATTVTHVQAKVCLAPCLLSKGITLTQHLEASLLHQSPVTAEVVQAAALHGAASIVKGTSGSLVLLEKTKTQ